MGKKSNDTKSYKLSAAKRSELKVLADAILVKSKESMSDEFQRYLELNALVDRIRTIEADIKPIPYKSSRDATAISKFITWCYENGAKFDKVDVKKLSGHDLGLVARESLKKDEIFVQVPDPMIFSYSKVVESLPQAVSQRVFKDCPLFDGMSNVRLAFALMIEKINPKSKFKPYLDILPEKFRTVLYFTPAEMKELQGTNALLSALKQVKFIVMMYSFLYKYLMTAIEDSQDLHDIKESFTYEFFIWAVSCVMTRQNLLPQLGKNEQESVLIPLWDLANHNNGLVNTQFNDETNCIESFALANFTPGDEVTMAYGNRTNEDFLVHNGFVFAENSNKSYPLRLALSKSDEHFETRSKILKRLGMEGVNMYEIQPELSSELLAFVRVFNMNKDQLQKWTEMDDEKLKELMSKTTKFDKAFEQKVYLFLLTRVKILLKAFPTTLEEDEELVKQCQNQKTKQMIVNYRILEKKSLISAAGMIEKLMK